MNLAGCASLLRGPLTGMWYRAFHPRYMARPLASSHSVAITSRYNEGASALPQFEILYFAEDHAVALHEVGAMVGLPSSLPGNLRVSLSNPTAPWAIVPVRVRLQRVADLTRPSQLKLLQTTAQELTGDWRANFTRTPTDSVNQPVGTAPTQELGQALHAMTDLEGFQTISARIPERRVLVVFPSKLQPGSVVEMRDSITGNVESIPASDTSTP